MLISISDDAKNAKYKKVMKPTYHPVTLRMSLYSDFRMASKRKALKTSDIQQYITCITYHCNLTLRLQLKTLKIARKKRVNKRQKC